MAFLSELNLLITLKFGKPEFDSGSAHSIVSETVRRLVEVNGTFVEKWSFNENNNTWICEIHIP